MNEVTIRLINLPTAIKATTIEDENLHYNVYINAKLAYADQRIAYKHELIHIINNHFAHSNDELCKLEMEADSQSK